MPKILDWSETIFEITSLRFPGVFNEAFTASSAYPHLVLLIPLANVCWADRDSGTPPMKWHTARALIYFGATSSQFCINKNNKEQSGVPICACKSSNDYYRLTVCVCVCLRYAQWAIRFIQLLSLPNSTDVRTTFCFESNYSDFLQIPHSADRWPTSMSISYAYSTA